MMQQRPLEKTVDKAGKEDDAAKTVGKAIGKAGEEDSQEDDHAFVSPEDKSKDLWEAGVRAFKEADLKGKVGDVQALADGKTVAKAKAGEAEVHATRMPSRRTRNAQIPMSPEVNKMIEDEVEKRLQERMIKSEPRTEVRRQLMFQEDDQDEEDKRFKVRYQERLEKPMQADAEMKRMKDEKDERARRKMEENIKKEAKARDEEQQRIKRQWYEEQQREAGKWFKEQETEMQKDERRRKKKN